MMSNNPLPSTRVLGPSKPPDFSKPDSAIPQCSTEQCNDDELGNLLGVITAGLNYFLSISLFCPIKNNIN